MNIIYIGTPEYACLPLEELVRQGHSVKLVITNPDKPKDRGKKLKPSPVKLKAEELGIDVITPSSLKNNADVFDIVKKTNADFVVVFAYGKILPKEILDAPKYACINIHASLLPKYRGAAPIQRAIMNGDEYTGISIMRMEEGLDTGDVYSFAKTSTAGKTAAMLYDELANLGSELLLNSLEKIASGELAAQKQDDSMSCYAEMVTKAEGEIDWNKSATEIDRLVRAFNDFPIAWTRLGDTVIKVYSVEVLDDIGNPGEIIKNTGELVVGCKEGSLRLLTIQAPGKNAMPADAYLRGHAVEIGTKLG